MVVPVVLVRDVVSRVQHEVSLVERESAGKAEILQTQPNPESVDWPAAAWYRIARRFQDSPMLIRVVSEF